MDDEAVFDPQEFLPYRMNRAAEAVSLAFQAVYKQRYGMVRPEWRVLFHLGAYGAMTATGIQHRSGLDKVKISRAVAGLDKRGWLTADTAQSDRRQRILALTPDGRTTYEDLVVVAQTYHERLLALFTTDEIRALHHVLDVLTGEGLPSALSEKI